MACRIATMDGVHQSGVVKAAEDEGIIKDVTSGR
jgi:hypothetical protein